MKIAQTRMLLGLLSIAGIACDDIKDLNHSLERLRGTAQAESEAWRGQIDDSARRAEKVSKELAAHLRETSRLTVEGFGTNSRCTVAHAQFLAARTIGEALEYVVLAERAKRLGESLPVFKALPYVCHPSPQTIDPDAPVLVSLAGWNFERSFTPEVTIFFRNQTTYAIPVADFGAQGDLIFGINTKSPNIAPRLKDASRIEVSWKGPLRSLSVPIFVEGKSTCARKGAGEECLGCELVTSNAIVATGAMPPDYLRLICRGMAPRSLYKAEAWSSPSLNTNGRGVVLMTLTNNSCGAHYAHCSTNGAPVGNHWQDMGIVSEDGTAEAHMGVDAWGNKDIQVTFPAGFKLTIDQVVNVADAGVAPVGVVQTVDAGPDAARPTTTRCSSANEAVGGLWFLLTLHFRARRIRVPRSAHDTRRS